MSLNTSVQLKLAQREAELTNVLEPLSFLQHVSHSKDLRDASTEAEGLHREHNVEASMRLDVFRAKQAAKQNLDHSGQKLSSEEQRLVDKMMLDVTRAGLALPEDKRERLTVLKKELSAGCVEFLVCTSSTSG